MDGLKNIIYRLLQYKFEITIQNGECLKCTRFIPDTNLNNVLTPAFYLVDYTSAEISNAPNTGEYFTGALAVFGANGFIVQIFFDGNMYFRRKFYGAWGGWIATTRDII